ncbi:zinc-dependent alcohol dehydrogenase [Paenibacillus humicola]|uniref:zinc-dependent alcohol dehydrogenase n=1 Tax=Paenibacillus humicola TaxID=3110540 RepID=UPI00237A1EEF|nr:zinc-binding alcohol dehydrogenase [Paenibacillus humicola]
MKGKAVVFTDKLTVSVREVDLPEPRPDEVVVEPAVSWISKGTESSYLRGERIAGDTASFEGGPTPFPIVPGYQKTGIVREVGSEVAGLRTGDRVFASVSRVNGMFAPAGGHVSPAVTAANQVWKLPEGADFTDYSGLVLTQVGYNCGMKGNLAPGDRAVVLGDGLVGQWTAQTLLHRGVQVLVAGRRDDRLNLLPAEAARLNARRDSLPEAAGDFAGGGTGIAAVVDTVGDLEAVQRLLPLLRRGADFVSAGFYGTRGVIDIQHLRQKEISLHAPSGWVRERMDAALEGIRESWLQTGRLVTHRFPAGRAADAWKLIADNKEPCLGVVLDWE